MSYSFKAKNIGLLNNAEIYSYN